MSYHTRRNLLFATLTLCAIVWAIITDIHGIAIWATIVLALNFLITGIVAYSLGELDTKTHKPNHAQHRARN